MDISVSGQVFVFFAMVLCGGVCGVVFDIFRGIRYRRKTPGGVVAIQDLLFWVIELILVYMVTFSLNYAHVRAFELVALIIGSGIYFMTVSVWVVAFISRVTCAAERVISLIATPVCRVLGFFGRKANGAKKLIALKLGLFRDKISLPSCKIKQKIGEFLKKRNKSLKKVKNN